MTTTDPDFPEWTQDPPEDEPPADEQTHDELHEAIHNTCTKPIHEGER